MNFLKHLSRRAKRQLAAQAVVSEGSDIGRMTSEENERERERENAHEWDDVGADILTRMDQVGPNDAHLFKNRQPARAVPPHEGARIVASPPPAIPRRDPDPVRGRKRRATN